jgi:hypothetical protein
MLQQVFCRCLTRGLVSLVLFWSLCIGLILTGCGCTAMGCTNTLWVMLEGGLPLAYTLEISVPEGKTLNMHCEGTTTTVTSNSLPEVSAECHWEPWRGAILSNFAPSEVTITFLGNNDRISQTFQPSYRSFQPNGPNCGPECRSGQVSLTLPGVYMSPVPIDPAQTATARPVMLEVNKALLQATIINATSKALRSGSAASPATATALQVQFEGNIATIEALRPTATSLNIVLVQRTVQPTDAPEATLFAQASEASRAASRSFVGTPTPIVPTPILTPTPLQYTLVATP